MDREMAGCLLPDHVLGALDQWWSRNAVRLANGTPGSHAVLYTPSRWARITPWPASLTPASQAGDARISRAEVASTVADALRRGAFGEALVVTYVWGKGKRGSPGGSGPATLRRILAASDLEAVLARTEAVTTLRGAGAEAAYAELLGRIRGLGPSFFTKFLYFAGASVPPAAGPRPLILDRVLARRLRSLAQAVGQETGHDPDGSIARWVWREGGWSAHRYGVYCSFMQAAAEQAAASGALPSRAAPDLLEYALFNVSWT
ncbi:hypothetical protein [Streptomyces sp. NPDC053755]|uniref:8-oxoguanine DNA glycosylase OGG fold protein n=1 Tax=Streptomyces sp. NPDC053755 TaxID=3155815 RepID=UPI00343A847D